MAWKSLVAASIFNVALSFYRKTQFSRVLGNTPFS
jgi:hypothetical protein